MDKLPDVCYENKSAEQQIMSESDEKWCLEKVEIQGGKGTFIYIKDALYPYKNYTTPTSVFLANQVKAIFIESIKIISKWYYIFIIPLFLKDKQILIDSFNRIAWRIISPQILKQDFLSRFSVSFQQIIFTFLKEYGIIDTSANRFASIFTHLIEYDNAYRLRLVDLFSETSKELLIKNPRREVNKLIKIIYDREANKTATAKKLINVGRLLSLVLLVPKVKRSFVKAIEQSDYDNLTYDPSDLYWVVIRKDYDFCGKTQEERKDFANRIGWKYPIPDFK